MAWHEFPQEAFFTLCFFLRCIFNNYYICIDMPDGCYVLANTTVLFCCCNIYIAFSGHNCATQPETFAFIFHHPLHLHTPAPCSWCIHAVACGAAFCSLPFSGSVKRTETAQGVAEAKSLTRHFTSAEQEKPPVHHLAGFRDKHGWHSTGEKTTFCRWSWFLSLSVWLRMSLPF